MRGKSQSLLFKVLIIWATALGILWGIWDIQVCACSGSVGDQGYPCACSGPAQAICRCSGRRVEPMGTLGAVQLHVWEGQPDAAAALLQPGPGAWRAPLPGPRHTAATLLPPPLSR